MFETSNFLPYMDSVRGELGLRIRTLRISRGLTQAQLAAKANLRRSYVSQIEKGKQWSRLDTIASIAFALKVNLVFLFTGVG